MNSQVQAALAASAQLAASAAASTDPLTAPSTDPLTAARNGYRQLVPLAGEPEPVYAIKDQVIKTVAYPIPIRLYYPSEDSGLPTILFFHGGWFIAGDLETHDRPLRALTNATGCIVVAVDYRLAPEHPFPAAIDDGYAILQWAAGEGASFGIDPNLLIIGGDSAGGAIATVLARKAAAITGLRVLLQVLLYPVTDPALQTGSWREFGAGPVITREIALGAWQMYAPTIEARQNPDAAPILAANLAGSPRALFILAESDPLRDEGLAYADRLTQAGVKVKTSLYKEMPHGFFQMAGYIDDGRRAMEEVAGAVRDVMGM